MYILYVDKYFSFLLNRLILNLRENAMQCIRIVESIDYNLIWGQ